MPLASSLASDAGLRTAEIGWLVGFLAVYVVVVGPVLFFAVRRRGRPELAWVAVPLVAVLFSSSSYVVGRNLRKATQLVHATVMSSGPGGPSATSYLGVFSRGGETARIGFPNGWTGGAFADTGQAASATLVTRTPDGLDARVPLEAGQFAMVHATGPAPGGGGLEVSAVLEAGGRLTGSVRNPTSFRLDDVAVFVGSTASIVGGLAPGEEQSFVLPNQGQLRMNGGPGPEFQVWGRFRGMGAEAPADFGLWHAAMRSGGLNFLTPDAIVAAGWTREFVPDVRVGGRTVRPEGRTVVIGRQQLTPPAQGQASVAVRRDIVRDPFANRGPGGSRTAGAVVRFVLPDGADTARLVLSSPFGPPEIWQDGGWRTAGCDDPSCRGPVGAGPAMACPAGVERCPPPVMMGRAGGSEWTVPATSVRDGVIYVRIQAPASFDQGMPFTIGRKA